MHYLNLLAVERDKAEDVNTTENMRSKKQEMKDRNSDELLPLAVEDTYTHVEKKRDSVQLAMTPPVTLSKSALRPTSSNVAIGDGSYDNLVSSRRLSELSRREPMLLDALGKMRSIVEQRDAQIESLRAAIQARRQKFVAKKENVERLLGKYENSIAIVKGRIDGVLRRNEEDARSAWSRHKNTIEAQIAKRLRSVLSECEESLKREQLALWKLDRDLAARPSSLSQFFSFFMLYLFISIHMIAWSISPLLNILNSGAGTRFTAWCVDSIRATRRASSRHPTSHTRILSTDSFQDSETTESFYRTTFDEGEGEGEGEGKGKGEGIDKDRNNGDMKELAGNRSWQGEMIKLPDGSRQKRMGALITTTALTF